jgi:Ca-activated chloride channel homolog
MIQGNFLKDFFVKFCNNCIAINVFQEILKKIALSTGGTYVRASNSNIGLDQIFSDIRKMKKQELESTMYTEYNDQFQIFAGLALLLLIVDFLIMDRKNRRLAKIKLFKFRL